MAYKECTLMNLRMLVMESYIRDSGIKRLVRETEWASNSGPTVQSTRECGRKTKLAAKAG